MSNIIDTSEGLIGSTLKFATDTAGKVIKNTGKTAMDLGGAVTKGVGNAAKYVANNKYGQGALAAGAGLFLARQYFKNREAKQDEANSNEDSDNDFSIKKKLSPRKYKKPKWLTQSESISLEANSSILEQNMNLPRYPVPPNMTKAIPKNPRSVVSFFMRRKPSNYRATAERDQLEIQRKVGRQNIKLAKSNMKKNKNKTTSTATGFQKLPF